MPSDSTEKAGRRPLRIGKYEVLGHIASGGMGAVYRARDVDLNREVALKILSPDLAVKPVMLERFRREARSAAKLRHDNIVAIYEFNEANGTYYLALEYVDGVDLHEYISRRGKLKPEEARQILIQAARALDHAHKQGIVHRDIKPSNFLVTQRNDQLLVKLTDLGLAREIRDDEYRVTRAGTTVGTVDYMSPEQARNSAAADIRSDIYSLGCTFYHMLGGCCPFPTGSLTERIYQHVESAPPDIRNLNGDVPRDLVVVLGKMLEKKPTDRYQTPLELLKDLESPESLQVYLSHSEGLANLAGLAAEEPEPRPRARQPVDQAEDGSAAANRKALPLSKRFRDRKTPAAEQAKGPVRRILAYWPAALGVAGVVLAVAVIASQMNAPTRPRKDEPIVIVPPPPKPPPPPVELKKPDDKKPDPETKQPVEPALVLVGPEPLELPALYQPRLPLERSQLRSEFFGPFPLFSIEENPPATMRVSRAFGPGAGDAFRSLAEAWEHTVPGRVTVIEIHDNGPLFVPSLPRLENREVVLRAGPGYRPLIVWDIPAPGKGVGPPYRPFLSLAHGRLLLEDLDVVVKWQDSRVEESACFFQISDGQFSARRCTFSQAGKHPRGVVLVQLEQDERKPPPSCRLSRCYARGADLIALNIAAGAAEALLEGCLIVGGGQALVQTRAALGSPKVRVIRSTLIAGGTLLHHQAPPGKGGFHWLAWDSLLARSDPAADGALVRMNAEPASEAASWRVVNCFYAGWRKYLDAGAKTLTSLRDWRSHWNYVQGDREQVDAWPVRHPGEPEEIAAGAFSTDDTTALFAATSAPGALGCALGAVPPGTERWLRRTYDRYAMPLLPLPDPDDVPPVPAATDGLYHGERLELNGKVDLGQHLQTRLETAKPGPHVVLHLAGSGEHGTSPIRLKGIPRVTIYVEPPKDKAPPLVLAPVQDPKKVRDRDALIEMEDGRLELIGARIQFGNTRFATMGAYMVKIRNGELALQRCWLLGPMTQGPGYFQALVRFDGQLDKEPHPSLVLHESVLIGKNVIEFLGSAVRLRVRQSVFLAAKEVFHLDVRGPAPPAIHCVLEQNTFAVRESLLGIRLGPDVPEPAHPLLIQSAGNLFADPFPDADRRSCLLRCDPAALSRGWLAWQGRGNAFDHKRLHAYAWTTFNEAASRQTFQVWKQFWGSHGELQPLLADLPQTTKHMLEVDPPQLDPPQPPQDQWQLNKLAWPAAFRPQIGEALPGADLVRLGILKKASK